MSLKTQFQKTCARIRTAAPVIIFFLLLFYSVMFFFNIRFVMIVSSVTVLFKINYRKYLTWRKRLTLVLSQLVLSLCAFLATVSLPLCIALNLIIPFLLVMFEASQFNPMGYFSGAMTFVFLQMRPVGFDGIAMQTGIMLYALLFFVIGQYLLQCVAQKKKTADCTEEKALVMLADAIDRHVLMGEPSGAIHALFDMQQSFYKKAYQHRSIYSGLGKDGKVSYLFALLLQRAVYFLSRPGEECDRLSPEEKDYVRRLTECIRTAAAGLDDPAALACGNALLQETKACDGPLYRFVENFLGLLTLILKWRQNPDDARGQWETHRHRPLLRRLRQQMLPDAFEMRFALRLSTVLTVGFVFSMVFQYEHAYWFVMNAFLLLRPMYEDSTYRMKTRFVGTLIGCLIIHLLLPTDSPMLTHLAIASFMVVGMYAEVPGTFIHSVFVTCFAMAMATLMLPQPVAIELRILYVAAAAVFVLIVNRFFFPTSLTSQFQYNIEVLFHLEHQYLRMVEKSLDSSLDYGEVGDAQMQYHLLYDQLLDYLKNNSETVDVPFYRRLFVTAWYLVSEAEQLLLIIGQQPLDSGEVQDVQHFITGNRCVLDEIQEILGLPAEKTAHKSMGEHYVRTIKDLPVLSYIMTRYSQALSYLYRLVITRDPDQTRSF